MNLTVLQLQTLKQWINTNNQSRFDESSVALLNAQANPLFRVYRTVVPVSEVMQNGFDWTRVDNLSVGKARIWEWMTTAKKVNDEFVLDPSKPNNRNGINEAWKGTQADLDVRAVVYTHCWRAATVAEKLFATGAGTAPNATGDGPGTMAIGAEGDVTLQNVIDAANS